MLIQVICSHTWILTCKVDGMTLVVTQLFAQISMYSHGAQDEVDTVLTTRVQVYPTDFRPSITKWVALFEGATDGDELGDRGGVQDPRKEPTLRRRLRHVAHQGAREAGTGFR